MFIHTVFLCIFDCQFKNLDNAKDANKCLHQCCGQTEGGAGVSTRQELCIIKGNKGDDTWALRGQEFAGWIRRQVGRLSRMRA